MGHIFGETFAKRGQLSQYLPREGERENTPKASKNEEMKKKYLPSVTVTHLFALLSHNIF
jgi:hypothetical protein